MRNWSSWVRCEPRVYQIGSLAFLLCYGLAGLKFDIPLAQIAVILASALSLQAFCSYSIGFDRVDFKSSLISGLSLCLLLRTNQVWLAALGAMVAISSKFLLRIDGKHIFNPTNFALVLLMGLAPDHAWVSPAQWGNFAFFAFLMLCLGGLVVNRASRTDVTLAFLAFYVSINFGRSIWLNEPISIPLHRLQNGGLLLFAFFMISDPKTTPDSRVGRILFAGLVATGAAWVQFKLFRHNGLLWSLSVLSLSVPLLNRLFPGPKYNWPGTQPLKLEKPKNSVTPYFYETATH